MKIDANLLKTLRANKNWSQEQLSEACGLSLRTIQRLENGGNASIESVRALAEIFEIDPKDLIIREDDAAMTALDAVKNGFLHFTDFSSRATRYEYWWFLLFALFVMAISTLIHEQAYQVIAILLILPLIAVGSRRLNDVGQSGWWQLLFLVPFGQVVVFYLLAQASDSYPSKPMQKHLDTV